MKRPSSSWAASLTCASSRRVPLAPQRFLLTHHQPVTVHSLQQGKPVLSPEQGAAFSTSIGGFAYVECSALEGTGVQDVLNASVRAARSKHPDERMNSDRRQPWTYDSIFQNTHRDFWRKNPYNEESLARYVEVVKKMNHKVPVEHPVNVANHQRELARKQRSGGCHVQ